MTNRLPLKLQKEPLIDALFEIRFSSDSPASAILPGYLFSKLDGAKSIESLPAMGLPKDVREADPSFKYTPLIRITWGDYFINVGDRNIAIACKYPYPGWAKFKNAIQVVIAAINEIKIIKSVNRYSTKYIDLIQSSSVEEQIAMVNVELRIANHKLSKENFQLRVDLPDENLLHIIQIVSSAKMQLKNNSDTETKEGLVIDVDTIADQPQPITLDDLLISLSDRLDKIHQANKKVFFDCITASTIHSMDPIYE